MIKVGNVGNIVLGVGDPEKYSLLGASFGVPGDILAGPNGGRRFILTAKDKMLRAQNGTGGTGGTGERRPPGTPYDRDWRDRYRRQQ